MSDLARLVIKRFPENRNTQLMLLRLPASFHCSCCKTAQKAKMLAVVAGDWEQLLCLACYEKLLFEKPAEPAEDLIPEAWLGAVVAVQSVEDDNMVYGVPFGKQSPQWEQFKAAMIEGDELCEFSSPPDASQDLVGRAGYALVRQGKVVRCIATTRE